jgi:hypothetical protein
MAKIIRRETRRRGFFGWVFLLIFLAFNALMLLWLISYWGELGKVVASGEAERVGRAIGGTIATGMILFVWASGSVITGLLALLTRGRRTIIVDKIE